MTILLIVYYRLRSDADLVRDLDRAMLARTAALTLMGSDTWDRSEVHIDVDRALAEMRDVVDDIDETLGVIGAEIDRRVWKRRCQRLLRCATRS